VDSLTMKRIIGFRGGTRHTGVYLTRGGDAKKPLDRQVADVANPLDTEMLGVLAKQKLIGHTRDVVANDNVAW